MDLHLSLVVPSKKVIYVSSHLFRFLVDFGAWVGELWFFDYGFSLVVDSTECSFVVAFLSLG